MERVCAYSHETKKYCKPSTPAMTRANSVDKRILRSKVIGRKYARELRKLESALLECGTDAQDLLTLCQTIG